MDALAGYGSDDSSTKSELSLPGSKKEEATHDSLLGIIGSPSDSEASAPSTSVPPTKKIRASSSPPFNLPEPRLAKGCDNYDDDDDDDDNNDDDDENNDSWILWKKNDLKQPPVVGKTQIPLDSPLLLPSTEQIRDNLLRLSQNIGDISNWAEHLRNQHEFHNPHFFESVVEHFGIQHPLASQLSDCPVRDYERELFPVRRTSEGDDQNT